MRGVHGHSQGGQSRPVEEVNRVPFSLPEARPLAETGRVVVRLAEHPDIVWAVARANGRANNFVRKNPDEAAKILQQYFGKVDPKILKETLRNIVPAVPADGKMTKEGWDNLIRVLQDAGLLKAVMDTTEGKYWTNEYLKDLGGKD